VGIRPLPRNGQVRDNPHMAALPEWAVPGIVDLRNLAVERLESVLAEETGIWLERLNWDFRPSADLVRRFVRMQSLNGYALVSGNRAIGYTYFVCEDNKGLIGDLYVLRQFASVENEHLLLEAALEALVTTPFVHRVECQLMILGSCFDRQLPRPSVARRHRRVFMTLDLARVAALPPGRAADLVRIEEWSERVQEDAAAVIARSYEGHIDSEINDQYRSLPGARRFLGNIIQYPGCGSFFQPASLVATHAGSGRLCGICLTSLVAAEVGHITQICVDTTLRGSGIGYELLRRSLAAMADYGCRQTSLTVTAANVDAIRLYERMGFVIQRQFAAYVWDSF